MIEPHFHPEAEALVAALLEDGWKEIFRSITIVDKTTGEPASEEQIADGSADTLMFICQMFDAPRVPENLKKQKKLVVMHSPQFGVIMALDGRRVNNIAHIPANEALMRICMSMGVPLGEAPLIDLGQGTSRSVYRVCASPNCTAMTRTNHKFCSKCEQSMSQGEWTA